MRRQLARITTEYAGLLKEPNLGALSLSTVALGLFRGPLDWMLPILLMEKSGSFLIGTAFSIANVDDTLVSLVGGSLADRYGRKTIILIGAFSYCVGCAMLLASLSMEGIASAILLWIATILVFGVTGVSAGPHSALLAESVRSERTGMAFSLVMLLNRLARACGSLAFGFLFARSRIVTVLIMLGCTVAAFLACILLRETLDRGAATGAIPAKPRGSVKSLITSSLADIGVLRSATLLPLLVLLAQEGLAHGICGNYYSPYLRGAKGLSEAHLGIAYSTMMALQAAMVPVAGWMTDRRGYKVGLVIGNVLAGAFLIPMVAFSAPSVAATAMLVSGTLAVFHGIAFSVATTRLSDPKNRATVFGGVEALFNLMFVIGPLIGGLLFAKWAPSPFIAAALLLMTSFVTVSRLEADALARRAAS